MFLRLFHRTTHAEEILTYGFSDTEGLDIGPLRRGVWLDELPYSPDNDMKGDVLEVQVPVSIGTEFEVVCQGERQRQFLIPADHSTGSDRRRSSERSNPQPNRLRMTSVKIETLGHLMNSSDSPAPMLIELLPGDGITMIHGHPRAGKSLVALEMMLAVATGTPAFDSSRLAVNAPAPVLYVSGEDGGGG